MDGVIACALDARGRVHFHSDSQRCTLLKTAENQALYFWQPHAAHAVSVHTDAHGDKTVQALQAIQETAALTLAVPPGEAARIAGVGRTTLYHAISSGALRSIKIGKCRLVAIEALRSWLLAHEVAG